MSRTETETVVLAEPHSSIPLRARSPHPHDSPVDVDKAQIELTDFSRQAFQEATDNLKSRSAVQDHTHDPRSSPPSNTEPDPSGDLLSTKAKRLRYRLQFGTLCSALFLAGWNDGTTGPLLPRIQEVYHVRFPTLDSYCHWGHCSKLKFVLGRICGGLFDFRIRCYRKSTLMDDQDRTLLTIQPFHSIVVGCHLSSSRKCLSY